jgi:phospholipase C
MEPKIKIAILSLSCAATAAAMEGATGVQSPHVEKGLGNIEHIVFIIKENRTFDNYFGTFPGAEGATSGRISTGDIIPLRNVPRIPHDVDHGFDPTVRAINGGLMDQFDLIPNGGPPDYFGYTQLIEDDIPNYFAYAYSFTLADHMFSSLTGPSFPNHLYTVGAQSGRAINNPTNSPGVWGCDSPPGARCCF